MKRKFLYLSALFAGILLASVSYGAAGYLYESDFATGTIYQFTTTSAGTLAKLTFATGLTGVRGLAFDHNGNLFVGQPDRIVRITPEGFMSLFASGLHGPNFLAVDRANNVYASDRDGNVLRYTPQGAGSVFVHGLNKPTGLAFDAAGNLFVGDYADNAIFKITPTGAKSTFALNMKGPQALVFDKSGILYVVNGTNGTVDVLTPAGSRATRIFNLKSPVGLAIDSAGVLYVSEDCNGADRIVKFTGNATGVPYATDLGCPLHLVIEPPRDPLFNISTRARVEPLPNHELIGGFIITGTARKPVLIRGLGPTLTKSGVQQPLNDPTLELHSPDGGVFFNDNWMDSQKAEIQSTGAAPDFDAEAAIVASLDPGSYTVILRGKAPAAPGLALLEIYDLDVGADSTLANLSSRGFVGTGENVMIAGFIVGGGNGAGKVLIRGLGPSLKDAGIPDALPDPTLTLSAFDANGTPVVVANNDDWGKSAQANEIYGTGIPPPNSLESAIVVTLTNGNYTAILQDRNGSSGVGLIEVYNVR
jgi:sugar lactone lactonase YvrE